MSLRNLTPIAHTVLDTAQMGMVMVLTQSSSSYVGHALGTSGVALLTYVELLAGDECRVGNKVYTSAENTTGTFFFPEIRYFHSMFNAGSREVVFPYEIMNAFVQGKTKKHDNLSRNGTWDPGTISPSNYIELTNSDTVFGKFTRIAVSKPHTSNNDRFRVIVTKGV